MDSQTRRIPPSEWESLKATILDLTRQKAYTRKEVMAIMKKEHGFQASTSQYEAQLRAWGFRKNLSADEWALAFETVDKLKSQRKEARILISGEPVDIAKLERARRTYNREKHRNPNRTMQGRSAGLRNASIEIRGTDGNWTPYGNPGNVVEHAQNQALDGFSSPIASALANASAKTGPNVEQRPHGQLYNSVDILGMGTSLNSDLSQISGPQDLNECVVGEEPWPIPLEVPQLSSSMVLSEQLPQHELLKFGDIDFGSSWDLMDWTKSPSPLFSPAPLEFYPRVRYNLDALPFKHFMKDLEASGNISMSRSLNFDTTYFSTIQSPVILLRADIISSMSEDDISQSDKLPSDVTYLWSSLRNLLPNVDLQGGYESGESLMTEDDMIQIKLNQILLYSTANGFAGLEDIPIQSVLKYLSRCADIDLILGASHSHVGKALAENLFRAAIEAKNKGVLKCLLAIPSIDVNYIVCIVNGQKHTPLERAAILQDLGMVQIFLDAGADVKKTCDLNPSDGGILKKLVNSIGRSVRVPPDTIEIGKVLLQAGAKLHLEIVRRALQAHNMPGLTYGLVSSVSDSDHSELIRDGFLSLIAVHLDDWQATQAIKNIMMACERTKCQACRTDYKGKLDWALIQGAKRGHLELVKLLLLHSKTPHRALSAAIRSGRSEVIDAILTLKPDINAPAHSIDDENWTSLNVRSFEAITTSHAEAIEARNARLVLEIEGKGALELLSEGRRFEPAIAAASRIGDMMYVRKLLKCCPSPTPSHMTSALLYAVQNDHEEIFQALLAAGADVNNPYYLNSSFPDALFAAVLRRNPSMVSAILSADISGEDQWRTYRHKGVETTILGEAVKWGDIAIIQDLLSAFPSAIFEFDSLYSALDQGDMARFKFLFGCGVTSVSALTSYLEVGLSRGDAELVQGLVERGADPSDPKAFAACVEKCPTMLPLLCEYIFSRKTHHVIPDFGTGALKAAIRCGQAGLAAVKLLLGPGLVDAKSFLGEYETPLGLAINVSRNGHHADFEVVRKLLGYGCDPNSIVTYVNDSIPNIKHTALLEAIDTRSKDLVKLLIDNGARVNHEANLGLKRTPLQKAVEVESLEIVTLLLEEGADINAKPAERGGATAFQLAAIRGNCIIAAKLLDYGADPHAPPTNINGRWPLEGAAENGRIQMIFFLWEVNKGVFDIEECQRAMELAEGNGYMACRDAIVALSQKGLATLSRLDQY